MTVATVCGALLVLRGPDRAFVVALAALIGTVLVWILTSVFWPARADRKCPACGVESLRPLEPGTTRGIACEACGHEDAGESSFLMAEEDGAPLEPILIGARAGRAGRAE
jgi:hypothetical protein